MILRKILSVFIILSGILLLIVVFALKHAVEKSRVLLEPAFETPVINSYVPKTGDLVLVHYRGHGMMGIPVAEHYPTHAGMIWVQDDGEIVVLECTKFSAPALPNTLQCTMAKERGVRTVPWTEYLNSVDNVMYIRRLMAGTIDSKKLYDLVNTWACDLDFETRIADSMTVDVTVAIGFVIVWPKVAEWCAKNAGLHNKEERKNRSFCSEFLVRLLQKLEILDPAFDEAYKISPASILKTVGEFDKLIYNKSAAWGPDEMMVRKL